MKLTPAKPTIIIAHVEGSGMAAIVPSKMKPADRPAGTWLDGSNKKTAWPPALD
jgi:hypothetical protein